MKSTQLGLIFLGLFRILDCLPASYKILCFMPRASEVQPISLSLSLSFSLLSLQHAMNIRKVRERNMSVPIGGEQKRPPKKLQNWRWDCALFSFFLSYWQITFGSACLFYMSVPIGGEQKRPPKTLLNWRWNCSCSRHCQIKRSRLSALNVGTATAGSRMRGQKSGG